MVTCIAANQAQRCISAVSDEALDERITQNDILFFIEREAAALNTSRQAV